MEEGRTSVVLFTPNVRKDRELEYFKEFEKVANDEFKKFDGDDDKRIFFIASGTSFGI